MPARARPTARARAGRGPRPDFPVIEPFTIPGLDWEFVDRSSLPGDESARAESLWIEHLGNILKRNAALEGEAICGRSDEKRDRVHRRFEEAVAARPELEWDSFVKEGGEVDDEMDSRPDLPECFLCARDSTGKWLGGISITNILIERDASGPLKASGFFVAALPPGIEGDGDDTIARTIHVIYKYILNQPLVLRGGRQLRFVQYNFLGTPQMRRTMNENPSIKLFMDLMRADFDVRGDRNNRASHIRFRSRDADSV